MRASAAKEGFRRIMGRAGSGSVAAIDILFLNSLRDLLRTGRGRDGSGLCVMVVGKVLDLKSGAFGARSDG